MSLTRLVAILKKEFIQMRRDRMTLGIMFVMPFIQLLIFGFAINTDVKHLPAIVFDQSLSQESRDLLNSFTATDYYDIQYVAGSFQEIEDRIQRGEAKVGIVIPPDYQNRIKHGRDAQVQVIVDASDSTSASSAISTAQLVGSRKSQEILISRLEARGNTSKTNSTPIDIRIRPWYNPDFITAFYMVPGIGGTILTLTMIMLTSLAIVRERERGTLEQLIVTPLKSLELMIGKILPYVLIGYVQLSILLTTGVVIFKIPTLGSIALLYLLTGFFIFASLALGLMISNIAKNQMQSMLLSFFILLPSILLSGFMFPREAMPKLFYYLGTILPLTHYLQIIRGILLKGNTLSYLWTPICALILFIAVVLTLSVVRFKKRLE
ncbi:MAG: ABC transporter permease [Negativicutes bacterium]|nr:ABC transporter permease [Negativicutes bacterium]